eukprot:7982227-Heterocapsa_arctica.AAC.1
MEGVSADLSVDRRRPSVKKEGERVSPEAKAPRTVEGQLVTNAHRTPPGLPAQAVRAATDFGDRVAPVP